jgi:hypothetical protein
MIWTHRMRSHWLPRRLLDTPDDLAGTLFRASRPLGVRLDFSKALSGAAPGALDLFRVHHGVGSEATRD